MSSLRRKIRRPFETAAFRCLIAVIPRLPRCVILFQAKIAGLLGSALDLRGRKIGLANLDVAFGDSKSLAEKKKILRASYTTMIRTFFDVIWFGTNPGKRLPKYIDLDESMKVMLCHKNQICITAHFGNWEIVGQLMALKGLPLHSIAMPVKNPEVNRMLIERREITGQTIVPRTGALRKLLTVLREGGKAAFLVDQNTDPNQGGIWADYFGLAVPVTPAPAALAAKTGSEILMGFCAPQPNGHYRVYITETIQPPEMADKEAVPVLTQQILSAVEREVQRHPEHWLWAYKRWKNIYRKEDADRYPFYANPMR